MPEAAVAQQPDLPLAPPAAPKRFIIPDDPVAIAPDGKTPAESEQAEATPPAQNTGDEATPAQPEAKPEITPDEAESKRRQRRLDRKIDTAYRQRAEAQARAELLQKEVEKLRQQSAPKAPDGEPKLADFDYDPEKYATAKAEYAKTQAAKELETRQRQESVKAERQRLISSWEEKVDRAEDKYDDFKAIVGELQPDSAFVAAIMEAENGEDVAYHLGKHPKEAEALAKLPPLRQVFEIGKLAAKLSAEPAKPKTPSKAPAPITPLTGVAPTTSAEPSESDDMNAWMKKRQKQVHGRR